MQIYYAQADLAEGYQILSAESKEDRLLRGRKASRPSGWNLFKAMEGQKICCRFCGIEADRWILEKGRRDHQSPPVLNLYGGTRLMTRDHLIPKSLGGTDAVANLAPACAPCNEARGNKVTDEDIQFAIAHPQLISQERIKVGLENMQRRKADLLRQMKVAQAELDEIERPFRQMGYL